MPVKDREHRLAVQRAYRENNRELLRERQRRWYQENRERVREKKRRYERERYAKNPAPSHAWAKRNPELDAERLRRRYRANREAILEEKRLWRLNNPDRVAALGARRRARERGLTVETVIPRVVFERDGYVCQICGEPTQGKYPDRLSPSLDHIVPLVKGGEHSYANTQCAHIRCNQWKGSRILDEAAAA